MSHRPRVDAFARSEAVENANNWRQRQTNESREPLRVLSVSLLMSCIQMSSVAALLAVVVVVTAWVKEWHQHITPVVLCLMLLFSSTTGFYHSLIWRNLFRNIGGVTHRHKQEKTGSFRWISLTPTLSGSHQASWCSAYSKCLTLNHNSEKRILIFKAWYVIPAGQMFPHYSHCGGCGEFFILSQSNDPLSRRCS